MSRTRDQDVAQVDKVLDTYMMGYIMALNFSKLVPKQLSIVQKNVFKVYPTWGETRQWLREIRKENSFHKSFFTRADVESFVQQIGDQYGRWQDRECRTLKRQLSEVEDRSIGTNGSGRVRISDFYGSALKDGNWQFSESQQYLNKVGALDSHDPKVPRVIIPNYINSPSNCLASSKFYSVCCINECEDLMDRLEHHFQAPIATPEEIMEFIVTLPSSSVSAGRTLPMSLLTRLLEIADAHAGNVPLHGRLFAQLMHHAYPRECPFPHLAGTVQPQTPRDYATQKQVKPTVTKYQMTEILQKVAGEVPEHPHGDEITAWSNQEELYVSAPAKMQKQNAKSTGRSWFVCIRPVMYLIAATAAAVALVRRSVTGGKTAAFACSLGGKDVFV